MAKKYIGIIGDVNPIEHWGGIIYDAGYGPHVTYFQSYEDMVSVYDFPIEDNVLEDLNWVDWNAVAKSIGMPVSELKEHAVSPNVFARASVYEAVGGYYGFGELDPYAEEMTIKQAERKWGRAVDAAHRAQSKARKKNPFHTRPKKPGKKKRKSGRPSAPYSRARAGGGRRKNPKKATNVRSLVAKALK